MKKMKRILALLLAGCMVIGLCSCGKEKKEETASGNFGGKEFIYVPTYAHVNTTYDLDNCMLKDGFLYTLAGNYDEETDYYEIKLAKLDLKTQEMEDLGYKQSFDFSVDTSAYSPSHVKMLSDGSFVMLESSYDENTGMSAYQLEFLDAQGVSTSVVDVNEYLHNDDGSYLYISNMQIDKNDNIYLANGDSKIWCFDKTGAFQSEVPVVSGTMIMSFGIVGNGNAAYSCYNIGAEKLVIQEIDSETKALGSAHEIPDNNIYDVDNIVAGANGETYLYGTGGMFELNLESGSFENILNWMDSDIIGDEVRFVTVDEEGNFVVLIGETNEETTDFSVATLVKTDASSVEEKEVLTLGVYFSDPAVTRLAVKFNRTSPDYRIEIKDYSSLYAYEEIANELKNEVLNGTAPDILEGSNFDLANFAKKGAMVDLNTLLAKDADISKEDFFDAVLEMNSTEDGVLYALPNSFYLISIFGRESRVGVKESWSLDEMLAAVDKCPDDMEIMDCMTKDSAMQIMMLCCTEDFIDEKTNTCSFESDAFKKVLDFTNQFPSEIPDSTYVEYDPYSAMYNDEQLMVVGSISSMSDYQIYKALFNGDAFTAVGFPSEEGAGTRMTVGNSFGITNTCKNPDAAWKFIKSFVDDSYYAGNSGAWAFPTKVSAFENKMKEEMTPEMITNDAGEEVETAKYTIGLGTFTTEIYAASQEDVDSIQNLIDNSKGLTIFDQDVFNIVSEEAAAYYDGSKSIDDVVSVIQSRVQTFLNEQN